MSLKENTVIVFYLLLNLCSSISIVCVNKLVFLHGFPYGTLLTVIHFFFTFLGLYVASVCNILQHKRLAIGKVVPLCLTYSGFVALTNLSLVYNPVSVYQLLKVLTTPTVVMVEFFFYGKRFSLKTILSLIIIFVGVVLATVTDTRTTVLGALIGLSAVLVTCVNQVWVGTKQKDLGCNGLQLLLYQAPISALLLVPMVPLLDSGLSNFKVPSWNVSYLIILSSICGLAVNASIFLVIGKTSALTYNVFGQLKVVLLIGADFLFFEAPWNNKIVVGILLCVGGVSWYGHLRSIEGAGEPKRPLLPISSHQAPNEIPNHVQFTVKSVNEGDEDVSRYRQ